MYHQYFGLKEPAFSIAVNPRYLFMSEQHKEALAHLLYGVQGGGFVLLSGEVGTGKTTIIRCLLEQLPANTQLAFILNPMADTQQMLATFCEELGINDLPQPSNVKILMDALQAHLLKSHAAGKRTVLLIDEAQLLSPEVLEQIRLLTNLETSTEKLLQIILVGQPELDELLAQPRLRQLSQRITARFHLHSLSREETEQYIEHRLCVAGKPRGQPLLSSKVVRRIHAASGGTPRLINIICERLLMGAYAHNKREIDSTIFNQALKEVASNSFKSNLGLSGLSASNIVAASAILVALAIALYFAITLAPKTTARNITQVQQPVTPANNIQEEQDVSRLPSSLATDAPSANDDLSAFYMSKPEAFKQLFKLYGVGSESTAHPCWRSDKHGLSCSAATGQNWQLIAERNRPGLLAMLTPSKDLLYVLIVGLSENHVLLQDRNGKEKRFDKEAIGPAWTAEFEYLWLKPPGYQTPLAAGEYSPVVAWVAEQFAVLDGQEKPITGEFFNLRLRTRVKIFQTRNGLKADGILGENTLSKLAEKIQVGPELQQLNP